MANQQVENLMKKLGCTEAEALQIIEDDKAIDQGKSRDFDLSKEQHKIAQSFVKSREHKKPTVYKFEKRQRKENTTKSGIIAEIYEFLKEKGYKDLEIVNKEREIGFIVGEFDYSLTLVQHRKPKS